MKFTQVARWIAAAAGSPWGFIGAFVIVVVWAITGPFLGFSDLWQLSINTGTTIVTFLMVFLIQSSQNQDTKALHAKLDELIRVNAKARDDLIGIEEATNDE